MRYREPLAKHDGVVSAMRAHTASTLLEAANASTTDFRVAMYSTRLGVLPIPRSFHTLIGLRPIHHAAFTQALEGRVNRLGTWS